MGAPTVCKVTISRRFVSPDFRSLIGRLAAEPRVTVLQKATGHEVAVLIVPDKAAGDEVKRRVEAELPEKLGEDLIVEVETCDIPPDEPLRLDSAPPREEVLDDITRMH